MQIDRLFRMIYILMDKKLVKARELADLMEVSVRTIYRDMETLSSVGVPVYTIPGRGGGIALLDNFVLNKSAISEEEQNQILFALQNMAVADTGAAAETLSKLSSFFQKSDTKWIEVDYSRWFYTEEDNAKFEKLKQAILNKNRLEFSYIDFYGNESTRTVNPLKLVFKDRTWYMQAFCLERNAYRTFKINRIRKMEVLDQVYEGIYEDIPSMIDQEKNMEMPESETIKMQCPSYMGYRIYEEFGKHQIEEQEDGSYIVTCNISNDPETYSYFLSYGEDMVILEPEHIKEKMKCKLQKMLENYTKS